MWLGGAGRSLRSVRHAPHQAGQLMKANAEIKPDVVRELQRDSQLSELDSLGVAVKDWAVVLTGHTPTYAEKLAAARAAERVLRSQDRGQRAEGQPVCGAKEVPDLFVGVWVKSQ
jgi:hypothetical protein